jgi:hypothetical protein
MLCCCSVTIAADFQNKPKGQTHDKPDSFSPPGKSCRADREGTGFSGNTIAFAHSAVEWIAERT